MKTWTLLLLLCVPCGAQTLDCAASPDACAYLYGDNVMKCAPCEPSIVPPAQRLGADTIPPTYKEVPVTQKVPTCPDGYTLQKLIPGEPAYGLGIPDEAIVHPPAPDTWQDIDTPKAELSDATQYRCVNTMGGHRSTLRIRDITNKIIMDCDRGKNGAPADCKLGEGVTLDDLAKTLAAMLKSR